MTGYLSIKYGISLCGAARGRRDVRRDLDATLRWVAEYHARGSQGSKGPSEAMASQGSSRAAAVGAN